MRIGDKMATKIIFYVVSCSAETEMDVRSLYVFGESQFLGGLPGTEKETHRRVLECQKRSGCQRCDAEVHKCEVERTKEITFPKNPTKEK